MSKHEDEDGTPITIYIVCAGDDEHQEPVAAFRNRIEAEERAADPRVGDGRGSWGTNTGKGWVTELELR